MRTRGLARRITIDQQFLSHVCQATDNQFLSTIFSIQNFFPINEFLIANNFDWQRVPQGFAWWPCRLPLDGTSVCAATPTRMPGSPPALLRMWRSSPSVRPGRSPRRPTPHDIYHGLGAMGTRIALRPPAAGLGPHRAPGTLPERGPPRGSRCVHCPHGLQRPCCGRCTSPPPPGIPRPLAIPPPPGGGIVIAEGSKARGQ